jgi:hypothetical protein
MGALQCNSIKLALIFDGAAAEFSPCKSAGIH